MCVGVCGVVLWFVVLFCLLVCLVGFVMFKKFTVLFCFIIIVVVVVAVVVFIFFFTLFFFHFLFIAHFIHKQRTSNTIENVIAKYLTPQPLKSCSQYYIKMDRSTT